MLADHCSAFIPAGGTAISQDDEAVSHMSCMGVWFSIGRTTNLETSGGYFSGVSSRLKHL